MKYLLDSNVCVDYLRSRSRGLKDRVDQGTIGDIVVCSIVWAELAHGAAKSAKPSQNLATATEFLEQFDSLAFDNAAALVYGDLRASLERAGTPIGGNDLMIASIALANGLTLVTNNLSEFARVPSLQLEDWRS